MDPNPKSSTSRQQHPCFWLPNLPPPYPSPYPYLQFPPNSNSFQQSNINGFRYPSAPVKIEENPIKIEEERINEQSDQNEESGINSDEQNEEIDEEDEEEYWNLKFYFNRPSVNCSAIYFDPNAAPMLTSEDYNQIVSYDKDKKKTNSMKEVPAKLINELDFAEEDDNPFIEFKHRRTKKKYKKYLSLRNCEENLSEQNEDSEKIEESINQSDQSQDKGKAIPHSVRAVKREIGIVKIEERVKVKRIKKEKKGRKQKRKRMFEIKNEVYMNLSRVNNMPVQS